MIKQKRKISEYRYSQYSYEEVAEFINNDPVTYPSIFDYLIDRESNSDGAGYYVVYKLYTSPINVPSQSEIFKKSNDWLDDANSHIAFIEGVYWIYEKLGIER